MHLFLKTFVVHYVDYVPTTLQDIQSYNIMICKCRYVTLKRLKRLLFSY